MMAESQGGLITTEQLLAAGLNRQAIKRRRDSGMLMVVLPGVYRLAGSPSSWILSVRATHMWLRTRGVLSHHCAGALQSLVEGTPRPIDVSTTGYLRSPHTAIRIRRVTQLETRDLRWFDGMLITNATRTVIDLAGDFLQFRDAHLFMPPERQYEIFDDRGDFVARVDFAYPDLMIAIECDGKKHHFGARDWERDIERRSKLAALGWKVIHISWDMLTKRPDELLALLREMLGRATLW
jgi:hypothetical protein